MRDYRFPLYQNRSARISRPWVPGSTGQKFVGDTLKSQHTNKLSAEKCCKWRYSTHTCSL